jgi:hypothetical protein
MYCIPLWSHRQQSDTELTPLIFRIAARRGLRATRQQATVAGAGKDDNPPAVPSDAMDQPCYRTAVIRTIPV